MRLSQKITGFLHNGVSTLWYFAVMAVKENFRNYVGRAGRTEGALSDELALLANGPSLADELPRLLAGARAGCDFLAVNYFAEHEAFERLRPAYYVLSDPQFFRASAQRDRVAALYRTLARSITIPNGSITAPRCPTDASASCPSTRSLTAVSGGWSSGSTATGWEAPTSAR